MPNKHLFIWVQVSFDYFRLNNLWSPLSPAVWDHFLKLVRLLDIFLEEHNLVNENENKQTVFHELMLWRPCLCIFLYLSATSSLSGPKCVMNSACVVDFTTI